jgi:hypothetical protein
LPRSNTGSTLHTNRGSSHVRQQSPDPRTVQVVVAKDATALLAHASLQHVHSAMALVALGADLGASKDLELWHRRSKMCGMRRR